MGVTRIDQLPENSLTTALSDTQRVSKEQKGSPQFVSGDNLAYFVSDTGALHDWSGRLEKSTGSGRGYEEFFIILTSDIAVVPLADISVTLFYSTDGVAWQEYSFARGISESFNGTNPQITRFIEPLSGREVPDHTAAYFLSLYGQLNARVAFKVEAVGTDKLAISITRSS